MGARVGWIALMLSLALAPSASCGARSALGVGQGGSGVGSPGRVTSSAETTASSSSSGGGGSFPASSTSSSAGGGGFSATSSSSSSGTPTECVTFEGCVDGSDYVSVTGGMLSIVHMDFTPMGEHPSCAGVVSTVNPNTSMYDPMNGRFAVNGVGYPLSAAPLGIAITDLASFTAIQARGMVTQTAPHQIFLNDDPRFAAALYVVQICGAGG